LLDSGLYRGFASDCGRNFRFRYGSSLLTQIFLRNALLRQHAMQIVDVVDFHVCFPIQV
jgi:hypothetical protein